MTMINTLTTVLLRAGLLVALLASTSVAADGKLQISSSGGKYNVTLGDQPFTTLHLTGYRKPILYPVMGPDQTPMTRNHPMKEGVKGEATDHPHHKSIWFGHGDINGVSFWHEQGLVQADLSEPVCVRVAEDGNTASISYQADYLDPDGKRVCQETTLIRFVRLPGGNRAIDWQATLHASDGELKLGDTKEGTMAIRTHPNLRVDNNPKQGVTTANGRAVNSQGAEGRGIWGKHAKWVDYSGKVEGRHVGVAIFDHPSNLRHPTTWHARTYGLVAANPFGLSHFEDKPKGSGDHTLAAGEQVTFRYRFVLHRGDAEAAKLDKLYAKFAK